MSVPCKSVEDTGPMSVYCFRLTHNLIDLCLNLQSLFRRRGGRVHNEGYWICRVSSGKRWGKGGVGDDVNHHTEIRHYGPEMPLKRDDKSGKVGSKLSRRKCYFFALRMVRIGIEILSKCKNNELEKRK